MSLETEQRFDVVIFHKKTREIDSIIGKSMRRHDGTGSGRNTAELRKQTGQERCNDRYDCEIVNADEFKEGDTLPPDYNYTPL